MTDRMKVVLLEPNKRPDVLIIAGEHSGDEHAARLIRKVLEKQPEVYVAAIGGENLREAGAELLFDLTKHSVVGLFEVLKGYSFFKRLLNETLEWIEKHQPKMICFVDYPGFNLRLAEKLFKKGIAEKAGGKIKLCYYIGPQIWAWKAGRRFKMAKYLNGLGVIFPFEVECYKDTDLDVQFVGHPFVDKEFDLPLSYDPKGPILLLPGSRKQAVGRIFPVMLDAFELLLKDYPDEEAGIIVPSKEIYNIISDVINLKPWLKVKVRFYSNSEHVMGKAVLGSSGTMSLISTLAGIPGAIVYKTHPITYWIGKRIAKVPFLGISNILLGEAVYPEYIQDDACKENLYAELVRCLDDKDRILTMHKLSEGVRGQLGETNQTTGDAWLVSFVS